MYYTETVITSTEADEMAEEEVAEEDLQSATLVIQTGVHHQVEMNRQTVILTYLDAMNVILPSILPINALIVLQGREMRDRVLQRFRRRYI